MIRLAAILAAAAIAASPLAAAPAKRALKPGAAKCSVNDEKALPCQIRKSDSGGMDVETSGYEPLLAMVVDGGLNLFVLVGDGEDRVPLIMDYATDPEDPACWRAAESDAIVWRLCIR
jgi:hypothetical protein